ncbi:MAG: HDOD domain-containing protein [Colwellia sp.]
MFDLSSDKMAKVVSSFQIPVRPQILSDIQTLLDQEEPDIEKIANLLASDVSISASILKIINSPFYGMHRKISEIKQAVMMLGLNVINSLVVALLLKQAFKSDGNLFLEKFWDDAVDIANAMIFIGNTVKSELPIDMLYSVGLFHNCGIAVLATKYPDYEKVFMAANNDNKNYIEFEERLYQTNHAVLGYFVASSWHLPKEMCQLIAAHHDIGYLQESSSATNRLIFAVLKMAENLVERVRRFEETPDWEIVKDDVLTMLNFSDGDYADIESDFFELF